MTTRARAPRRTTLVACVAALVMVACGSGPPEHVRIGVVAPLTGPRAYLGQELVRGAELAVDDLNDAGGLLGRHVELVVEDDGDLVSLPGQLADLAERSHVSAVIGPEAPGIVLGPRSPLSRRDVPVVLPSAFAGQLDEAGTLVVRTVPGAQAQARTLGRWLREQRGVERVAVLVADAIEGDAVRAALARGFDGSGAQVVAWGQADPDATQLGPAVAALRRDAPGVGAVLLWGQPPVAARATRAARDQGWDVQIAVPSSAFVSEYRTLAGPASEGVVLPFPFSEHWFGEELLTWMLRYHRDHGLGSLPQLETLVLDAPVVAVAAYDAVGLVAAAVREAGSREPEAVTEALKDTRHEGILRTYDTGSGRETYDADDLFVARFHHLAVTFDVDARAPERAGERLWRAQVNAEYVPTSLLEGPAGDVLRRIIADRRAEAPGYEPPEPPPGPVAAPAGRS